MKRGLSFLSVFFFGFVAISAYAQAPTNLVVKSATNKAVSLSWTGSGTNYSVQRRILGGSYTTVQTVNATSATDTTIDPYTDYQYQIVAGTSSSNQVTVGPPPSGFTVAAGTPGGANSPAVGNYGYDLSMTLDGNGDPAIAFVNNDPNLDSDPSDSTVVFRSWNRAQYAWNPTVTVATVGDIATDFRTSISLAYDPSTGIFGIATEVNLAQESIKLYTSPDGVSWTNKVTYTVQDEECAGPSLALSGGNIYLAYGLDNSGIVFISGQLSAASTTWANKVAPALAGTDLAYTTYPPSVAVDSAGTPAVAYWVPDHVQSYNSVLLFWRPLAGTQVKVTDTQNIQNDNQAVKLVFFKLNPRIVEYGIRSDAGYEEDDGVHFVRSEDGGKTWLAPVLIPADGSSSTDFPFDMTLGSQGQVAIGMGRNSGSGDEVCGNPKVSLSSDLTNFKTCAVANISQTGDFGSYPSAIQIAYGGNDKLYLLWMETDNPTTTGIVMYREPPAGAATAPSIETGGVIDAAGYGPNIVAGSWVEIKGANISSVTTDWSNSDFSNGVLPTSLVGVQVKINGQFAPVYFVTSTQVNVQSPSGISGSVPVQIISNGVASNTVQATAVSTAPALFTYSLDYKTFYPSALFTDYVIVGDPAVAGTSVRKAKPNDIVLLYATGLSTSPAGVVINSAIGGPSPVTVTVGTQAVTASFAGLVAVGEFQINFAVPNLPPGNYPVTVTVAGQKSQTGVVLPIGN